jgi:hypothetical protein
VNTYELGRWSECLPITSASNSTSSRLTKPGSPSANLHLPATQNQHSPSPSQLNNPMIYAAPPPIPRPSSARPANAQHNSWFGRASPSASGPGIFQHPPPPPTFSPSLPAYPSPGPRPNTQFAPSIPGMPAPPPGPGYANPYAAGSPTSPTGPGKQPGGSMSGLLDKLSSHLRL